MNYQQRNRALSEGIRERCKRTGGNQNMAYARYADLTPNPFFNVKSLFFCYDSLCVSLHDAVADD
jgi:hypothetical protein